MKTKAVIENDFKETEIGLVPEDWQVKGFEDCIDKERISRDIKIPQGKYKKVGRYPIVDQGASFIAGYTDDKSKLYSGCLPVIVFGDHTRIFKFVDFSFSLGADGTKLIQPKDFLNPKYFYYCLCSLTIESKGYNRHYKYLKEKFIAFPEKPEQQKIAFVLSKIQQTIEQQDRIIETTRELKKSLMNKLFTEGLHGEDQKKTGIGLLPKSWGATSIGEIAPFQGGFAFKSQDYHKAGVRLFKIANVSFGKAIWEDISFLPEEYLTEYDEFILSEGDIVMAMTRPIVSGGIKVTKLSKTDCPCLLNQRVGRFQPATMINPDFLYQFLFTENFVNHILYSAGGSQQPNISANKIEECLIPLPTLSEQKEIADILSNIDKKIQQTESRKQTLQSLFKTMLYQLMTGKVRVKDFDFEVN